MFQHSLSLFSLCLFCTSNMRSILIRLHIDTDCRTISGRGAKRHRMEGVVLQQRTWHNLSGTGAYGCTPFPTPSPAGRLDTGAHGKSLVEKGSMYASLPFLWSVTGTWVLNIQVLVVSPQGPPFLPEFLPLLRACSAMASTNLGLHSLKSGTSLMDDFLTLRGDAAAARRAAEITWRRCPAPWEVVKEGGPWQGIHGIEDLGASDVDFTRLHQMLNKRNLKHFTTMSLCSHPKKQNHRKQKQHNRYNHGGTLFFGFLSCVLQLLSCPVGPETARRRACSGRIP